LKEGLLFVNKKVAKSFCIWARAVSAPQAQTSKSFCAAFSKKRPLSSLQQALGTVIS
jgi:hypothetical protein